jgi:NADH-quinone oxidoreductase subunit H
LPEAEAELVSGYNVEYSSTTFALFFIGEYANVITSTLVTVFFFFGGCGASSFFGPFVLSFKILFFLWFFLVLRAALPRFRYDQLIQFG